MKRVLIISPYFPPSNAADMHRIRMSLSFFNEFGWQAEVVTVKTEHSYFPKDPLLLQSVPQETVVHYVDAFPARLTSLAGLGSIALRSLWFYRNKVNSLLSKQKFDLVYFSTTQFPVCILGAYWKKNFSIPYVIDMQDPWYSTYYEDQPKSARPPKYWFSHRLNQWMEPKAMKSVDGLISVSDRYLQTLESRYENCGRIPRKTITFGAFEQDFRIASENRQLQPSLLPVNDGKIKIVYAGRGGSDMSGAVRLLFRAFRKSLDLHHESFENFHFYFIGTSYAAAGEGIPTIHPVAVTEGVGEYVTEITGRIPFYQSLNTLADADALFVPGSDDPQYTASKIYPYMMANRPLLALFHPGSSVIRVLKECKVGTVITFDEGEEMILERISQFLEAILHQHAFEVRPEPQAFEHYSARAMTGRQCELFNEVVK